MKSAYNSNVAHLQCHRVPFSTPQITDPLMKY